jgi:hypothetical protein
MFQTNKEGVELPPKKVAQVVSLLCPETGITYVSLESLESALEVSSIVLCPYDFCSTSRVPRIFRRGLITR